MHNVLSGPLLPALTGSLLSFVGDERLKLLSKNWTVAAFGEYCDRDSFLAACLGKPAI